MHRSDANVNLVVCFVFKERIPNVPQLRFGLCTRVHGPSTCMIIMSDSHRKASSEDDLKKRPAALKRPAGCVGGGDLKRRPASAIAGGCTDACMCVSVCEPRRNHTNACCDVHNRYIFFCN